MRVNFYDLQLTNSGGVALVKERGVNYEKCRMDRPEDIALFADRLLGLGKMAEERIYMLALNSSCKPIGVCLLSKGTVNMTVISPREIYIRALLTGAVQIALIHNHPSGNPIPTEEDKAITQRVRQVGELLNIPLVDHVIVGGGNGAYLSFQEAQLLRPEEPQETGLSASQDERKPKTERGTVTNAG